MDTVTRNNYDTSEHRAARLDAYRTDDPQREFEREIDHTVHSRTYFLMLQATIAELQKETENHGRRYRTLMPIAAELIEYWYNNTPETIHYRQPTAENILRAFESHRIGSMWARLLHMAHDAEGKS